MKWMLIDTELPRTDINVLTYSDQIGYKVAYFNGDKWYCNITILEFATHWMPLPAQPEVK